ncbi:Acetoacetate metabolism regulatory protein atoC [Planctomycetales bacterium 10988]|nr:Acetoacetate metabolism regulatory protein atoC [Planctomycetales bacterium 10988]
MSEPRVLVVDDDEGIRRYCSSALKALGSYEVSTTENGETALKLVSEQDFDIVMADVNMPKLGGLDLLKELHQLDPDLVVLLMTGEPSVDTAVDAIRLGASDYIQKPFSPEDLISHIRLGLEGRQLRRENQVLRRHIEKSYAFDNLIGESDAIKKVYHLIQQISQTDVDVLINGETGTGKEMVARSLHRLGSRAEGPFIPVDCGAIPENLMESEFFGHERGAFTGADARSIGLMELAQEGTFFLDEVAELPILLQAKLLRALQERKIRRVGGKEFINANVRVIAATGKDLDAMVRENRFRQDLFFRINVVRVNLPPLRERDGDVVLLAKYYLDKYSKECNKKVTQFSSEALEVLQRYRWPGNVRELQNAVRFGITMTLDEEVGTDNLPDSVVSESGAGGGLSPDAGFFELRDQHMAQFEQEYLARLLENHRGNVTQAAEDAQIPVGTYYRLMKKYDLKAGSFR